MFLPGKSILENPYAANEPVNTWRNVTTTAKNRVLSSQRHMSALDHICR